MGVAIAFSATDESGAIGVSIDAGTICLGINFGDGEKDFFCANCIWSMTCRMPSTLEAAFIIGMRCAAN